MGGCNSASDNKKSIKIVTSTTNAETPSNKVSNVPEAPVPQPCEYNIIAIMFGVKIFDKAFKEETLLETIISEINISIPDYNSIFIYKYLFNDKNLFDEPKSQLKKFLDITGTPQQTLFKVEFNVIKCGLDDLPIDLKTEIEKNNYICKPLNDPLELVIFEKKSGKVHIKSIDDSKDISLRGLTDNSAYCSGKNQLFISGGDKYPTNFWYYNIKEDVWESFPNKMKKERRLHSMIFIPNRYVFIVGGRSLKSVEYFDCKSKEFIEHSNLNYERPEPSLCLIDDTYLYLFSGFNIMPIFSDKFERINLRSSSIKWENIKPILTPSCPDFNQIYFANCFYSPTEILFIGGIHLPLDSKDECCFIYDYKKNSLKKSELKFEKLVFLEKYFYPIGNNNILIHNETRERTSLLTYFNDKLEEIHLGEEEIYSP